jgi:hypothetical protein
VLKSQQVYNEFLCHDKCGLTTQLLAERIDAFLLSIISSMPPTIGGFGYIQIVILEGWSHYQLLELGHSVRGPQFALNQTSINNFCYPSLAICALLLFRTCLQALTVRDLLHSMFTTQ